MKASPAQQFDFIIEEDTVVPDQIDNLQISEEDIQRFSSLKLRLDAQEATVPLKSIKDIQLHIRLAAFTVTEMFFENLEKSIKNLVLNSNLDEDFQPLKNKLLELVDYVRATFDCTITTRQNIQNLEINISPNNPEQEELLQIVQLLSEVISKIDKYISHLKFLTENIQGKIEINEEYLRKKEQELKELNDPLADRYDHKKAQKLEEVIATNKAKIEQQNATKKQRKTKVKQASKILKTFLKNQTNPKNLDELVEKCSKLLENFNIPSLSKAEEKELLCPEGFNQNAHLLLSTIKKEQKIFEHKPGKATKRASSSPSQSPNSNPFVSRMKSGFKFMLKIWPLYVIMFAAYVMISKPEKKVVKNSCDTECQIEKLSKQIRPTDQNKWSPPEYSLTMGPSSGNIEHDNKNLNIQSEQLVYFVEFAEKLEKPISSDWEERLEWARKKLETNLASEITEFLFNGMEFTEGQRLFFNSDSLPFAHTIGEVLHYEEEIIFNQADRNNIEFLVKRKVTMYFQSQFDPMLNFTLETDAQILLTY
ncbi:hypothetical protein ACFL21_01070 [Patescibacteria group bacterium]